MKRGYLQISFAWLFAIIAGAFILFLAIYFTVKIVGTEEEIQSAKTGEEIGILLNPLETSFETGQTTSLIIPVETRVYNNCSEEGTFGKQKILVSQKSFNKWTKTDLDISFENKYIFSEDYVEGKNFYLFSKPFEFPFKIANLIYMTSKTKEYCFMNPPEEIKNEIGKKGDKYFQENIKIDEDCSGGSVKVCFSDSQNCDVAVNYDGKFVDKKEGRVYFEGDALMYAAIFSDKEIYECQVARLMERTEQLASLYQDKAVIISQTAGCNTNINFLELINSAKNFKSSANLGSVNVIAEEIGNKNKENSECRLW